MIGLDSEFMRRMKKILVDSRDQRAAEVVAGTATDFADYRARCAYVAALDDVLGHLDDTRKSMLGEH